ncbi:MAG: adenylate/guanylate cyclase domain-containing protein [Chloroflexi bacterium]|nr:adenylate/guanylate cyclase domain-containing protein [Chloroflexota bacterium]
MGTAKTEGALFEQAVANLLAVSSRQLVPTSADDPFDFAFEDVQGRRTAVEVRTGSTSPAYFGRLAAKSWRVSGKVHALWLVTPDEPSQGRLFQFRKAFRDHPLAVEWLGSTGFQRRLGLEPLPLNSEEAFAALGAAAAVRRLPVKHQHSLNLPPADSSRPWAYMLQAAGSSQDLAVLMTLESRLGRNALDDLPDAGSAAEYLRLGAKTEGVVTLMSDLQNFSTVVRVARPEDVTDAMARYYRRSRDIVQRHGGFLHQFTGDGLVALFGYPRASPEAAQSAIRAAAELRLLGDEILSGLTERMNEDIDTGTRVGITTDDIWALNSAEYGIEPAFIGNGLNLAARLQTLCAVDGVLIDNRTYNSVRHANPGLVRSLHPSRIDIPADYVKGQLTPIVAWQISPEATAQFAKSSAPTELGA